MRVDCRIGLLLAFFSCSALASDLAADGAYKDEYKQYTHALGESYPDGKKLIQCGTLVHPPINGYGGIQPEGKGPYRDAGSSIIECADAFWKTIYWWKAREQPDVDVRVTAIPSAKSYDDGPYVDYIGNWYAWKADLINTRQTELNNGIPVVTARIYSVGATMWCSGDKPLFNEEGDCHCPGERRLSKLRWGYRCFPADKYRLEFADASGQPIPDGRPIADIEPGQTASLMVRALNKDGQPAPGINIKIEASVDATSGGHDHGNAARPKGNLGGAAPNTHIVSGKTNAQGWFPFSFTAPIAAGEHTIRAECPEGRCDPKSGTAYARIKGLVTLTESSGNHTLIGRRDEHQDNHYVTPTAALKVHILAFKYRTQFPTAHVLHLNDASLEWGGVFDLNKSWTPGPNNKPGHKEHRRGTVIDIRANEYKTAIPPENYAAFERLVSNLGGNSRRHGEGDSKHYHVRLMGVPE